MSDEKKFNKKCRNSKKHLNTDKIEGKIEIPDTRERRDGPGGN